VGRPRCEGASVSRRSTSMRGCRQSTAGCGPRQSGLCARKN
jgi:hypothetical protein